MTIPKIALATAARLPDGAADTTHLQRALADEGCSGGAVVWSDPDVDWSRYDLVVLHSPWDYTDDAGCFLDWLERAAKVSALVNPPALVRWNANKSYLLDLASAGVPVVPSVVLDRGADASVEDLAERLGGRGDLVLKPAVGAGGRHVVRLPSLADVAEVARKKHADQPCLVQSFQPAILTRGELSAICVDGAVTHVVLKSAGGGEFRIHERYGGRTLAVPSEPWIAAFVRDVLSALPIPGRVARVDFTVDGDSPILMEVEVIEPDLYLRMSTVGLRSVAQLLAQCARSA